MKPKDFRTKFRIEDLIKTICTDYFFGEVSSRKTPQGQIPVQNYSLGNIPFIRIKDEITQRVDKDLEGENNQSDPEEDSSFIEERKRPWEDERPTSEEKVKFCILEGLKDIKELDFINQDEIDGLMNILQSKRGLDEESVLVKLLL